MEICRINSGQTKGPARTAGLFVRKSLLHVHMHNCFAAAVKVVMAVPPQDRIVPQWSAFSGDLDPEARR